MFAMRAFFYSYHAGDLVTSRSRTGCVVFINNDPIFFYSKKQVSCETSSFGSEFVAMKSFCEHLRSLRHKLCVFGITVEHPAYVFGNYQSALSNSLDPHPIPKKKSLIIAYHFIREGIAHLNLSHVDTKSFPSGEKITLFTGYLLHYLEKLFFL